MDNVDLVVIGAGPGGYVSALTAAQNGAKVVLIEKNKIGGTCLNWGCVPTKVLSKTAEYLAQAKKNSELGVNCGEVSLDMHLVQKRKNEVVETLAGGVSSLLEFRKVEVVEGVASIEEPGRVAIKNEQSEDREIKTANIIIATGSSPVTIPGVEFDNELILDSSQIIDLEEVPPKLLIIGGGVVGIEFASIFNQFGSEVTLVEMMPSMLPFIDSAIVEGLMAELSGAGINIHTSTRVTGVEKMSGKANVILESEGETFNLEADKVLLAAGRKPNAAIGEKLGITEAGKIPVNEKMETKIKGIYAIGDVAGNSQLASVAYHEAIIAASNITGEEKTIDYKCIPQGIFTLPEVSGVGLTEQEAAEKYEVITGVFPFSSNAKALAGRNESGFIKVIADQKYKEILGAFIIGPSATELIHEFALAIKLEATLEEIADMMHAHPTLSEAAFETVHVVMQKPVHFI